MPNIVQSVAGVLLAGGRSSRMGGGDKCLRPLGGRPMLARAIERARPQVGALVLNANGDAARFGVFGLPVVSDPVPDFAGPLAGILAGLQWVRVNRPAPAWMASFATDVPFFPADLVARLMAKVVEEKADLACAASAGRTHPVFGLWPVRLADDLHRDLTEGGIRKVDAWTANYRVATVEFPSVPLDPFLNVNRPEDEAEVERLIDRGLAPR